jgi:hypothetical protein
MEASMIRPDTPPGPEIICINDSPGRYGPSGLRKNEIYTVKSIERGIENEFLVVIHEVPPGVGFAPPYGALSIGYLLSRFRYLDLPPCLTDLLAAAPLQLELTP